MKLLKSISILVILFLLTACSAPVDYTPSAGYHSDEMRYSSSIDSEIDNLYAKYSYYESANKLPLVILIHGFNQDASSMTDYIMHDMADYGFFAISVGMRGRNGAKGNPDVSGRELYDIYDVIGELDKKFKNTIDFDNVNVVGYSGGGGNAYGLAVKFPDTFNNVVSHFGISDYGYDEKYGWWQTFEKRHADLQKWIGYSVNENRDAYYSRAHYLGLPINFVGKLWAFHDRKDVEVLSEQTDLVTKAMTGKHNYYGSITDESDKIRWTHASPHKDEDVRNTRDYWGKAILNKETPNYEIDDKGNLKIQGYVITDKFKIWLGNGTEEVADLSYDILTNSYTIVPSTGKMEVKITQGRKSVSKTIDKEMTLFATD